MVEHHPLGLAGRAARVDEQGQRVGRGLDDVLVAARGRGKLRHVDHRHVGDVERRSFVDDQAGAGVLDLERGLAGRQARVDRREGGSDPPGGEHDDHELDAVGQHRRGHVARAEPGGAQHRRGGLDACEELGVGEGEPIIVDARRGRVERSALVGQGGQRRSEDHAEQPTDGGRWWLRAAATSLRGSFVRANREMWRFARTPDRRAPSGAGARRRARSRVRRWGSAGRGGGR